MMTTEKFLRKAQVSRAFTPSAPISDQSLFADRPTQVMACLDAYLQTGRHIALYGERGVGKTSLANVIPKMVTSTGLASLQAVRVDCNTQDSYNSIWKKIFRELGVDLPPSMMDAIPGMDPLDPDEIRYMLGKSEVQRLVVIDEFDRVEDDDALSLLADTVKTFSDHAIPVTLMFVGVAGSMTNLLGEHESIKRNVEQVPMPRMSEAEMTAILDKGIAAIDDLSIAPQAVQRIVETSEGLPHFAHTLGGDAAAAAVNDDRNNVTLADVARAEANVIKTHSMVTDYRDATQSAQPGHLFEEVILACAYAPRDSIGCFRPGDLREPLSLITRREMKFGHFQRHLTELSGERRHALYKEGTNRNFTYRFRDPLIQPFVKMMGRATGRLTPELAEQLSELQMVKSAKNPLDPTA